MDMQFGIAVVVILLGLGLTQMEGGGFLLGAAWGTIAMGCVWVSIRTYKSYKKRS